jgi:hypothetical protein
MNDWFTKNLESVLMLLNFPYSTPKAVLGSSNVLEANVCQYVVAFLFTCKERLFLMAIDSILSRETFLPCWASEGKLIINTNTATIPPFATLRSPENQKYNNGSNTRVSKVAVINPPITTVASGR